MHNKDKDIQELHNIQAWDKRHLQQAFLEDFLQVDNKDLQLPLVFEAEDVAQLVAEVTGEDVEVEADENSVVFTVGNYDYTVEPEGTEEILESSTKVLRGKRPVRAASRTRRPGVGTRARRPVGASTRRPARKVSK